LSRRTTPGCPDTPAAGARGERLYRAGWDAFISRDQGRHTAVPFLSDQTLFHAVNSVVYGRVSRRFEVPVEGMQLIDAGTAHVRDGVRILE
jgi:hypothetical protein